MQQFVDSIVISSTPEQMVLLVLTSNSPDRWCLPGGWLEQDEDPLNAACREVNEETGIEVERATFFASYYFAVPTPALVGKTSVYIATGSGSPIAMDDAIEARYFPLSALPVMQESHAMILSDFRLTLEAGARPMQDGLLPAQGTEPFIMC